MQRSAHLADYQYDDDSDNGYETAWDRKTHCNSSNLTTCAVYLNGDTANYDVHDKRDPDIVITTRAVSTKLSAKSRS